MVRLKNYIFPAVLLMLAALISGCGMNEPLHGRFYDDVLTGVMKANPDITDLSFYDFSVTDSVTVEQEVDAARVLFRKKMDYLTEKAGQYRSLKKKKNAAVWEAKAAHTDSVILRLDSLFAGFRNNGSDILYYCCRFSGNGKRQNGQLAVFDGWYATVSPDGRVFNVVSDISRVRQGMGCALPGYTDITSGENNK